MPDLFDHASGLETKFTEMAIASQLQQSRKKAASESEEFCFGCGRQIPPLRRKAVPGCEYCVECQALRE